MHNDISLIALIAVGFVVAAIFGYIADRLRLPALVGYLVAGIVIGPFTPGFVADASIASQLSEMGVILLMFGVGLHFSIPDLKAVRGIAIPGALMQISCTTLIVAALSTLWGWSFGHGIIFGLCLSVASTVVLLKALEERNLTGSLTARVAVGWLIVEDLAMVLVLVLLPATAELLGGHATEAAHATDDTSIALALAITVLKLGGFAIFAALIGPRVVPWVLIRFARTGSRELFTLAVLAIAMGIAFGSALAFGVSFALGAFLGGIVMAESQLAHRAAANSLPLQDAFSVLFFVSMGMLFDPTIILHEPAKVFLVLGSIVVVKTVIAAATILVLRYPAHLAISVGASVAQIGEFSFILGGLAVTYGLMTEEARDLILAGAILSIILNPAVFEAAGWLERMIHTRGSTALKSYGGSRLATLASELERIQTISRQREQEQEQKIILFLETFPLFSMVDTDAHEEILLLFGPRAASPGERVIRSGDRGGAMYFIVSGSVEVQVDGRRVAQLGAGAYFGEMALLSNEPRSADVTAVDYCQFLALTRRDFNQFMSRHPELRAALISTADARRLMNQSGIA